MPIYEFECGKCGKTFEEILLGPKEKVLCPYCASRRIRRLFSEFAVHGGRGSSGSSASACGSCSARSCSDCK